MSIFIEPSDYWKTPGAQCTSEEEKGGCSRDVESTTVLASVEEVGADPVVHDAIGSRDHVMLYVFSMQWSYCQFEESARTDPP